MRWKSLKGDIPRVCALADVLFGVASADHDYGAEEVVSVQGALIKALGVTQLSGEVADHIRRFDPYTFDLRSAVSTLNLESDEDRLDLLRTVAKIALVDGSLHERELAYMHILGALMLVQRKVVHLIIRDVKETYEAQRAEKAAAP